MTREYTVTVGDTDVTQDVKIHPKGDVDGNGKVELSDAQMTLKAALKIITLNEKQQKLDKVMDELKDKYGYESITKAGELTTKKLF